MKISIIIPAYNCEKYLERCINSIRIALRKSKYSGEIIIVDNNSTDNTPNIIKKLSRATPTLIVAERCLSPGASAARNYGLKKAKGTYVWFIDADDTIRDDAIVKLVAAADEVHSDVVMMGVERIYPDGHTDYLSAVCPREPNYKSRFVRYGLGPFQVIMRRQWWTEHKFEFREGIIHEDMELMSALMLYIDNYNCVNEPLYNYYQNANSVLHKSHWDPHFLDIFPALESLYSRFKNAHAVEEYHDELEWFFVWNLLIDSVKDFCKFPEGKEGLREMRKMLKKYFPNWRENRFLKQKPLKLRFRVKLNYYKH